MVFAEQTSFDGFDLVAPEPKKEVPIPPLSIEVRLSQHSRLCDFLMREHEGFPQPIIEWAMGACTLATTRGTKHIARICADPIVRQQLAASAAIFVLSRKFSHELVADGYGDQLPGLFGWAAREGSLESARRVLAHTQVEEQNLPEFCSKAQRAISVIVNSFASRD